MRNTPIVIVEDDIDDCDMLLEALRFNNISNDVRCFDTAVKALEYLRSTNEKVFVVISDINMPIMNGLEFKKAINADTDIRQKNIPFIFLTTSSEKSQIEIALNLNVQGFFIKPIEMDKFQLITNHIVGYWKENRLLATN